MNFRTSLITLVNRNFHKHTFPNQQPLSNMGNKKPLSEKKLKRLLNKEKKKERDAAASASTSAASSNSAPRDREQGERHPHYLRGKEIGMWYKEKNRMMKKLKLSESEVAAIDKMVKSEKLMKAERKLSKRERRAQLEKKQRNEMGSLYKITIDPAKEEMINNFLDSSKRELPTFLFPLHKYYKKISPQSTNVLANMECSSSDGNSKESICDFSADDYKKTVNKLKNSCDHFPENEKGVSIPKLQSYLLTGAFTNEADENSNSDTRMDVSNDSLGETVGYTYSQMRNDRRYVDSFDKYKLLEETPFKRQFLNVLCGDIQSNLEQCVNANSKLKRNKALDAELREAIIMKSGSRQVRHMMAARSRLPAFKMQTQIVELIRNNQVILISGETGCGKTTQVAQFILDDAIRRGDGSLCNVICTQPRRISAISVAERVADERGELVGRGSVGYQIRLEKKIGRQRGSILFCTTGILLQYMQSDPALQKYSHVILDEIHERDVMCDFVLTILKDIIVKRRDLKVILMSATLNAEQFSKYFDDCPVINIPGYTYPVEEHYLEDILYVTRFSFDSGKKSKKNYEVDDSFKRCVVPYVESLRKGNVYPAAVLENLLNPDSEKVNPEFIAEVLKYISKQKPGAVLIFVPGWEDINSVMRAINESDWYSPSSFLVIPLHSMLSSEYQKMVFDRPPPGMRKIVIATNIAETSITIDDIVYVIDCGKTKIKNYDVVNNISTLRAEFVSLANARQRRGRAGRVQSGVCFHLFSRGRENALDDYPLPEMLRTRLEEVILNIKLLQLGRVEPFLQRVLDPPNRRAVSLALELLLQLNALDENENLTPLGYHLAKLPLDPQIGKMLLMGVTMSCLNPILSIAATLSHKDPFYLPVGEEKLLNERKLIFDKGHKSDHLIMAEVLEQWEKLDKRREGKSFCNKNYLIRGNLNQLCDLKLQFAQYLREFGFLSDTNYRQQNLNLNSTNIALIKAVICSGLYPNVAVIRHQKKTNSKSIVIMRTSEDGKVSLHPKSVNNVQQSEFESCFLVYHEKLRSSCVFLHDTTMIAALPLLIFCSDFYISGNKNQEVTIELNKQLRFTCEEKIAALIVELKLRLCWLLEHKLSHPGQITWQENNANISLLRILTDLFTAENDIVMKAKGEEISD